MMDDTVDRNSEQVYKPPPPHEWVPPKEGATYGPCAGMFDGVPCGFSRASHTDGTLDDGTSRR